MDRQDAINALEQAATEDAAGTQQADATTGLGAAPVEETPFTNIDPNSLPPELQPVYKSLQADYTRKRQADAEVHKLAEQYGGSENLQRMASFVYDISTNPNAQLELYNQLTSHLQSQGYSVGQAQAAAAQAVADVSDSEDELDEDEGDYYYEDPRINELLERQQMMEQYIQTDAVRTAERDINAYLDNEEAQIRSANPSYTDDDIDGIYALALSTDFNLSQAQQQYEAMRARWAGAYLQQKQSVPTNLNVPKPAAPHGEQPMTVETIHDPRIRSQAEAMLRLAGFEGK